MLNKNKFEKVLKRILDKNFERCSICRKPFPGPCHTFAGLDSDNKVQNVGSCCRTSIVDLRHGGVYTTAPVDTQEGQSKVRELLATHPCKEMMGHA